VGLAVVLVGGCSGDDAEPSFEELDMALADEDFAAECILDWVQVRRFYMTNLLGLLDEALEVAHSPDGGTYPPGTLIQLVPMEAMFKRGPGWNADTNDWEFFALDVTAEDTTIVARGAADTVNQFGGNCFDCHREAEPQWDMVCEQGRGCEDIPLSPELITSIQNGDPRCQ
jgi:hypothetical protein